MNKFRTIVVSSLLMLTISACSGPKKVRPQYEKTLPDYVNLDGSIRHEVGDERVVALWKQAEEERRIGQFENATKLLNSALEYAPEDPVLWSRGAELYLTVRENGLAENYATKSNFYSSHDSRALQYRNWLIIKHAREMRGDLLGTRNAQQMVQKFQK